MAREQRREHYVPRFYLESFSTDSTEPYQLTCYDKIADKVFERSVMNIAQEEYFYDLTESQVVEEKFKELEGEIAKVYRTLLDTGDITGLSDSDRYVIAVLVSHQHVRTRKFRAVVKQASEHTLEHVDDTEAGAARGLVEAGTSEQGAKVWQTQLMANAIRGFAEILYRMNWTLFVNETSHPLWTSDHPVAVFNPLHSDPDPERGIERRGSKIHFPLSPDLVLGIFDPKAYPVLPDQQELTEKDHVDFQNTLQVEHSHRQVYAPTDDFTLARGVIEEHPEYADLNYSDSFPDIDL